MAGETRAYQARTRLISAVFRFLAADRAEPHANADAEHEYSGELVALAARDLTRATEALPADQRPVGWNTPDVDAAESEGWAVLLDLNGGGIETYAYPFDEHEHASRFAAYLTAEVDPARVVPLAEVGPGRPGIVWQSPLVELLTWREHELSNRSDRWGDTSDVLLRLVAEGRMDRLTAAEVRHAVGIINVTELDAIRAAERGEGR